MSWLFSRALVEAYSEANFSDGEQSAPLKSIPMPQAICSKDKMMEFSRLSRYGMIFAPSMENLGKKLLTRASFSLFCLSGFSPKKENVCFFAKEGLI